MAHQCWPVGQIFGDSSIIDPTFINCEETSSYWSVQFFSACCWSAPIGKSAISFFKTSGSYEVSSVTINQQTAYDSGTLHQSYGIIRGLPMNPMRVCQLSHRLDSREGCRGRVVRAAMLWCRKSHLTTLGHVLSE